MIKENNINKLPPNTNTYKIIKIILLLSVVSLPVLFVGSTNSWFSLWYTLLIFIGIPISIWAWLDNRATTFTINKNKIEINWGILIKKTRTILIKAVQNVKIEKGILSHLCGVWIVSIWTASPSQHNINNAKQENRPDGLLILTKEDSKWLNDFIASNK